MKRILISLATIGVVSATALGLSQAFFSDTETSSANTLAAGKIDLKIDNTSYYNGALNEGTTWGEDNLPGHLFFNFNDIKPSDWGEDTISLHVDDNDAWACMKITRTKDDDNTCTEPEKQEGNDPSCSEPNENLFDGELGKHVSFIFWADDGDNVLETNETDKIFKKGQPEDIFDGNTFALSDSGTNIWGAVSPLTGGTTYYIGKAWCFGQLTQNPVPAGQGQNPTVASGINCNGANLNNASQSDTLLADVEFSAYQSRNNPNFRCDGGRVTPTPTASITPTPIACSEGYATVVEASDQGVRKDGSAVLADRSNTSFALGAPQTLGNPYDTVTPSSFFSLGFPNQTKTASIILKFAHAVVNQPGNDIKIYEVTGGPSYPDEKVKIEVAPNLGGPWTLVSASSSRDADLDLPGSVFAFKYLKLTDVSNINDFESTADGYDLDAIKAYCVKTVDN